MVARIPRLVLLALIALCAASASADEPSLDRDLERVAALVQTAEGGDATQRRDAMRTAVEILTHHVAQHEEVAVATSVLTLGLERNELQGRSLDVFFAEAAEAKDEAERRDVWLGLRDEIFARGACFLRAWADDDISAEAAGALQVLAEQALAALESPESSDAKAPGVADFVRELTPCSPCRRRTLRSRKTRIDCFPRRRTSQSR